MEKPKSGYSGSGFRTYPLSISVGIVSIPKPSAAVGLLQPRKKQKLFLSEISADPQKRPYGVKRVPRRIKNGHKYLMKIDIKFNIS
jgi:hypothetical protein